MIRMLWSALRHLFAKPDVPEGPWDAIVVPGAAVRPDGTPSPTLARRVEHAVALFHEGRAPVLVVSGAVVTHPPAEGLVGTALAQSLGVPHTALVAETTARDTLSNASAVAALGLGQRVLVVTCDFHVLRAGVYFRRHFAHVHVVGVRSPRRFRRVPIELLALMWRARRTG